MCDLFFLQKYLVQVQFLSTSVSLFSRLNEHITFCAIVVRTAAFWDSISVLLYMRLFVGKRLHGFSYWWNLTIKRQIQSHTQMEVSFGGWASCLKTVGHLDCKRFKQRTFQLVSSCSFIAALTHDFKPQFLTLKCLIQFSQCWNSSGRLSYLQLWNTLCYSLGESCVVRDSIAIYLNALSTLHIIIL